MIKPNHTRIHLWLFKIYSNFFLNLAFRNVQLIGEYSDDKNLPVLMIANHFTWWDGIIQMRLNLNTFKKKFYFMMLEEGVLKFKILRRVGACSISKESRDMVETLQHLVEVIKNPENLYLFFPQGKIESIYTYPYKFEKGTLNYIIRKTTNDFQLVFNVNLIDYASYRRPELSIYYKTYEMTGLTTADDIERDYNAFANDCITKQKSA